MSELEELLEKIDPRNTIDHYSSIVEDALNNLDIDSAVTPTWEEFKDTIFLFYSSLTSTPYGTSQPNPDALDYIFKGEAMMLLDETYGENGSAIAFNMAKKGIDGGLYQVLKSIGSHYAQKGAKSRIWGSVVGFLGGFDYKGVKALSEEYIAKFGHILPIEMKEKGGYWLIKNFEHVLCQHPHIIKQFRETNK